MTTREDSPAVMRRGPPAALALAAAVLLLAPALAHEGDNRPHVQSFQETRAVKASVTRSAVLYELDRPSERTSDSIRVQFDSRTGALSYEYREEEARPDSALRFRWVLHEIVEFHDRNLNQEFDPSADRVERAYPLSGMQWNISAPRVNKLRGQDVTEVVATGHFGATGEFRIQFVAAGVAMRVQFAEVHPQDVKMNWNFANFPFRAENTRFALVTRVETPVSATLVEEMGSEGVLKGAVFTMPGRMGFFDWATTVRGNSTREPPADRVIGVRLSQEATRVSDSSEARSLVFSYPRADLLLSHDPSMGLEYAPPADPPILPARLVLGLSLSGGLIGAAAFGVVYHRRHGRVPFLTPLVERVRAWWARVSEVDEDE